MAAKNNKPAINPEVVPMEREQKALKTAIHHAQYSGPIPPASEFAKYKEVIPDAPERILKVFEQDSEHVRHMNEQALVAEVSRDKRDNGWLL